MIYILPRSMKLIPMNKLERAKDISLSKFKDILISLKKLIDQTDSIHTCGFCQEYECHECEGITECDKMKQFVLMPRHSIEEYLEQNVIPYLSPPKAEDP